MEKYKVVPVLLFAIVGTTGCSAFMADGAFVGEDEGRILINADAEGMRALSDWTNGLVNNTKTPPEMESSHYQMRKEQSKNKVLRLQVRKGGKK